MGYVLLRRVALRQSCGFPKDRLWNNQISKLALHNLFHLLCNRYNRTIHVFRHVGGMFVISVSLCHLQDILSYIKESWNIFALIFVLERRLLAIAVNGLV